MKIKLLLFALLATSAHASLIDLTPGGFTKGNPPPIWKWLLTTQMQIAGANIVNGKVVWSPFEPLGAKQFNIIPFGAKAVVSWDTVGTGYYFIYLLLEGNDGTANIYGRTEVGSPVGMGNVTINGSSQIQGITFYGVQVQPAF